MRLGSNVNRCGLLHISVYIGIGIEVWRGIGFHQSKLRWRGQVRLGLVGCKKVLWSCVDNRDMTVQGVVEHGL